MAMGDAFAAKFLNTGAILLKHEFEFEDDPESHAKFCVLLENYDGSRETTIVALLTTNKKYKGLDWALEIPSGTSNLKEECYLDLNNYFPLRTQDLVSLNGYKYIGQLPEDMVEDMYLALEEAYKIPEHILLRLFGY